MSAHPEVTEARERIARKRGGNSWKGTNERRGTFSPRGLKLTSGLVTNGRYSRARSKNLVNKTVVPLVYSASWLNFHLFHASSPRSRPSLTLVLHFRNTRCLHWVSWTLSCSYIIDLSCWCSHSILVTIYCHIVIAV